MQLVPQPDDFLPVETPENVAFGYDVAGIGSRFLAALVDSLVIVAIVVTVNVAFLLLANTLTDVLLGSGDETVFYWLLGAAGLIAFGLLWGYYIFFEMLWNGQSPGKRLARLRVIRADGTPVTLTESIIRNLVRLIDFLPAYYAVGVVTMFIDGQSRRLGDLAAGTLVVRDRPAPTLDSLVATAQAPVAPPQPVARLLTAHWPLERLTPRDLEVAQDFLRRRAQLTNRDALALRLARSLAARLDVPIQSVPISQAEDLLAEIVAVLRQPQA